MTIKDLYKNSGYSSEWESSEQKMWMAILNSFNKTYTGYIQFWIKSAKSFASVWGIWNRKQKWLKVGWWDDRDSSDHRWLCSSTQYAVCYCQYCIHFQQTKFWKRNKTLILISVASVDSDTLHVAIENHSDLIIFVFRYYPSVKESYLD